MSTEAPAKIRSFYMYEVVDGGAGAVASYPHRLFVFIDARQLVEYLESLSGLESDCVLEGEEAVEDFKNRVGVDQHHLWVVEHGRVVRHLDFEQFESIDLGAEGGRVAFTEAERVAAELEHAIDRLALHLDVAALSRALPRVTTDALTAEDGPVPVVWDIEKRATHVGETVKLGAAELDPGMDTFD